MAGAQDETSYAPSASSPTEWESIGSPLDSAGGRQRRRRKRRDSGAMLLDDNMNGSEAHLDQHSGSSGHFDDVEPLLKGDGDGNGDNDDDDDDDDDDGDDGGDGHSTTVAHALVMEDTGVPGELTGTLATSVAASSPSASAKVVRPLRMVRTVAGSTADATDDEQRAQPRRWSSGRTVREVDDVSRQVLRAVRRTETRWVQECPALQAGVSIVDVERVAKDVPLPQRWLRAIDSPRYVKWSSLLSTLAFIVSIILASVIGGSIFIALAVFFGVGSLVFVYPRASLRFLSVYTLIGKRQVLGIVGTLGSVSLIVYIVSVIDSALPSFFFWSWFQYIDTSDADDEPDDSSNGTNVAVVPFEQNILLVITFFLVLVVLVPVLGTSSCLWVQEPGWPHSNTVCIGYRIGFYLTLCRALSVDGFVRACVLCDM